MTQVARSSEIVLVVGEDIDSRTLVRAAIEREVSRVVDAATVQAIKHAALHDRPSLILISSPLPGCDEIATCNLVRSLMSDSDVAMLLLAASDDEEFIEQAYTAGVSDVLFEPLNSALLRHRARVILDTTRQVRRLRKLESEDDELERDIAAVGAAELPLVDGLTGLKSRQCALEILSEAIRSPETQSSSLAVLCIDLDDFKRINESLGHTVGDELLRVMADRLQNCLRRDDVIARSNTSDLSPALARVGDDEFMVIVRNTNSPRDAERIGERIRVALNKPLCHDGQELVITASIGIAGYPGDGTDGESLVKNADVAMHQAKAAGGNIYRAFNGTMAVRSLEHLQIEDALRRAIANDGLELHYQPKLGLASGQITGVEALMRWNHPQRGAIPPGIFVPLAERTGMIVELTQWALRRACAQILKWQTGAVGDIPIAVNLSGHQFYDDDVHGLITRLLHESSIEPRLLELELTETMLMDNTSETVDTLHRLKEAGVSLAIDDFGTGYSSLSYLRNFPIDTLKIDRCFVAELQPGDDDASICKAIIALGHTLGLKVIAEGVEQLEQLAILREYGCDEIQGFYFARPQSAADVSQFILDHRREGSSSIGSQDTRNYA